jgi:hypothetical protein
MTNSTFASVDEVTISELFFVSDLCSCGTYNLVRCSIVCLTKWRVATGRRNAKDKENKTGSHKQLLRSMETPAKLL